MSLQEETFRLNIDTLIVLESRLKISGINTKNDLDLRSNDSRDHYHEDSYLVPSPRCGFCFEAAL